MKSVPNRISDLQGFFFGFFLNSYYFSHVGKHFEFIFTLKIPDTWDSPVGLLLPVPGPMFLNPVSTWHAGHASSSTCLLPPATRVGIQPGPTVLNAAQSPV
jgi:hypothetical protein